jgi:hypothetical protein
MLAVHPSLRLAKRSIAMDQYEYTSMRMDGKLQPSHQTNRYPHFILEIN